jgi:DNA-binding NarL/FixJ family response regulator
MSIRVLLVDDHAVVRQGLRALLLAYPEIEVIGEASEGETALQIIAKTEPDVTLLDLLMPGMDGISVLQKLKALNLKAKVLILTSSIEEELIRKAMQAGAKGYVLKAIRASELAEAIKRVAKGQNSIDPDIAQILFQQADDPLEPLTHREREVFDTMARGLNNSEIAERLQVGETTVRTHVASVLDKLGLRDRTQVMAYALKRGLIKVDDLP